MSWLARSLANSLRLHDDDDDENQNDVAFNANDADNEIQNDTAFDANDDDNGLRNDVLSDRDGQCSTSRNHGEEIRSPPKLFPSPEEEEEALARGVKEDLTELKQTLTKQFWGVANFLAPPPPTDSRHRLSEDRLVQGLDDQEPSYPDGSGGEEEETAVVGIRSDLAEIGGKFRSMMNSSYFPFGMEENERENDEESEGFEEDKDEIEGRRGLVPFRWEEKESENVEENEEEFGEEEEEEEEEEEIEVSAVGITDEVLAFARNIGMHPETWLDFPLDPDEDLGDFIMTEAQRDHALIVKRLAPRLAALCIELCPCHMSESYFWKVYFVLLYSRLSKHDARILSTQQVMEARTLWMQELHKQTYPDADWYGRSTSSLKKDNNDVPRDDNVSSSYGYAPEFLSPRIYSFAPPPLKTANYETVKHLVENTEVQFIDKAVIEENPVSKIEDRDLIVEPSSKKHIPNYEDDDDDWLHEEDSDFIGKGFICNGDEEDISFSDLEDDDVSGLLTKSKTISEGFKH